MTCNSYVFRNGVTLVNLREVNPALADQLCERMCTDTLAVDWFFHGGSCIVLYVGQHSEAVRRFAEFAPWYSIAHDEYLRNEYADLFQSYPHTKYEWSAADCRPAPPAL